MTVRFRTLFLILCVLGCLFFVPQSLQAQEDVQKWFNKNISYDIYIGTDDHGVTVIKDVMILELITIDDKLFMTVQPSDFSFNKSRGFIAFEHIKAILPNEALRAIQKGNKRINFR